MTHTTQELREALETYAEGASAPDTDCTVQAVGARIDRSRRRRSGILAAVAAAALVAATVGGLRGFGPNTSAPVPASPGPTRTGVQHDRPAYFADHADGYRLAEVVDVPLTTGGHTPTTVHVKVPDESLVIPLGSPDDATLRGVQISDATTKLKVNPSTGSTTTFPVWRRQALPIKPERRSFPSFRQLTIWAPGTLTLSATTTLEHPRDTMPVAVYAPVSWNQYPIGRAPFTNLPTRPVTQPGGNPFPSAQQVVHSTPGRPNHTVKVTMAWPQDAESLLVSLLPTTTGRFRISLDGQALSCGGQTWCTFWDSDLSQGGPSQNSWAVGDGSKHTITIEAQDTTGPWRAVLTPDGAPKHDAPTRSPRPSFGSTGDSMTATPGPTK